MRADVDDSDLDDVESEPEEPLPKLPKPENCFIIFRQENWVAIKQLAEAREGGTHLRNGQVCKYPVLLYAYSLWLAASSYADHFANFFVTAQEVADVWNALGEDGQEEYRQKAQVRKNIYDAQQKRIKAIQADRITRAKAKKAKKAQKEKKARARAQAAQA